MELHHIQQRSAGGPDTFDNCIPLCFDCHGDMRSYDHRHPKGRKFSEAELVAHRDAWYGRYAASGGAAASPEHMELDRATFRRLRERLPYDGVIRYLQDRYIGQPYARGAIDPLHEYLEDCRDPTFEFLDADLEGHRAVLNDAVHTYAEHVLNWTFADRPEVSYIQPEMKHRDPDRYYELVHTLAQEEGDVIGAYSALVRAARRKLGIQ